MSPNEDQLRAALHADEGDSLDAGAVVERAQAYRRARRQRVGGAVAAAVVIAAVGVGGGLLAARGGSTHRTAADRMQSAQSADGSAQQGAGGTVSMGAPAPTPTSDGGTTYATRLCAATVPVLPDFLPSQPAPVFTGTVTSATICAYRDGKYANAQLELTGQTLQQLVDSIRSAHPFTGTGGACLATDPTLVIHANYAAGRTTVLVAHPCSGAVRGIGISISGWQAPPAVRAFAVQLGRVTLPPSTPGRVSGSPIR